MGRFVHAAARLAQSQIVAVKDHIWMGAERDHMGTVEANEALDAVGGPFFHLVDHMLSRCCHCLFNLRTYGVYIEILKTYQNTR